MAVEYDDNDVRFIWVTGDSPSYHGNQRSLLSDLNQNWNVQTKFCKATKCKRSRGSSVTIVSGYGLGDGAIGVRSPAEAKDFSSNLCVQTGSEAHPASCTMGTGGPFLGAKRGRGVTLTTHPQYSAELKNK
jgi:hypothetical protein